MFKKTIILAVSILLLASTAIAKKKKTVDITDDSITDTKFGWSMSYADNWKTKSFKEPDMERLFMTKKNYSVNPNLRTYGGEYTIPTVSIFISEFDGTVDDYEALMKKGLIEHRSDNKMISKLGLFRDSEYIISGDVIVDSTRAKQVIAKRNYKRVLDVRGQVQYINDHEVHEIYIIKVDNFIYMIQMFCEREYYETNALEFHNMLESFQL